MIDPSIPLSVRPVGPLINASELYDSIQQSRLQKATLDAALEDRRAQTAYRQAETEKLRRDAQREADGNAALDELFTTYEPGKPVPQAAVGKLYRAYGAERATAIVKGLVDFQNADLTSADGLRKSMTTRLAGVEALPEARRAAAWQAIGQDYIGKGVVKPEEVPDYSPETLQYYKNQLLTPDQRYKAEHPAPVSVAPGTSLVNPTTGQPVFTAPERPSFQSKDVMLNGKRATVNFDPHSGKYTDASGQDVSAKVAPIPPASLIINDQRQRGSTMPDFALTDARPVGPDGNKPDQTIRMTPNGLYQAAQTFIASGQYPPTGRGTDPISVAQREAINAKVGAIAAAAGMDVPSLRAFYKSNSASLTQQQKLYDSAQSNINTADKNVVELEKYLSKLPDTGSPLFNQPLRAFATKVQGDPNMGPIATYLASVQGEYGKIINSSNGGAVLTDSARHEAQNLLNPNATVAQMIGSIQALKTEGGNRLLSIGEQIQRIATRMQGGPSAPAATAPQPAPAAASGGIAEGTRKPIPGVPGGVAEFRGGKWIRVQ